MTDAGKIVDDAKDTLEENLRATAKVQGKPKPKSSGQPAQQASPFEGKTDEELIDGINGLLSGSMPHAAENVNKIRDQVISELKRRGSSEANILPPM